MSWSKKHFCISAHVKNSSDNFLWGLITVYGSAYEEGKQEFINELHEILSEWDGPTLVGGDFNLIRTVSDKNNGNINFHWADAFNEWINHWGLIEFKIPLELTLGPITKNILLWLSWIKFWLL